MSVLHMPNSMTEEACQLPLIAVVGPTACGKTRRAVSIAANFNGEIVSGDSRQVYRCMDIGTGKDLDEYGDIPYHLIDICPAGYKYNLHEYLRDYELVEQEIRGRRKNIVLCGGTGMYVEAVLSGMRLPAVPENTELRLSLKGKTLQELTDMLSAMKPLHNVTDVDTCARAIRAIEIQRYYEAFPEAAAQADRSKACKRDAVIILLDIPRDERRRRITDRLDARLNEGLVEEVRTLIAGGVASEDLEYYGLEYKFVTQYVTGKIPYEQMRHDLEIAIHQFAKRQMTWWRGMERRGFKLHPVQWDLPDDVFLEKVSDIITLHHDASL